VLDQNILYYLMPWLPNEEKEDYQKKNHQLFRELARLHTLSVREIQVGKDDRKAHLENTLLQWEKDEEFLSGFLEACEGKDYMSPFELQFCLYYHEASQALAFSKRKLEAWYEKTKEQEKARMVMVHGKLSTEHFLYDEKGYGFFMNFESAKLGSPIHDLLPYLSRTLKGFPKRYDECIDWTLTYNKYFPLREDEMHLFMGYFSHPAPFIRGVQAYHKRGIGKSERKFVQQLQRHYWHLKNTEYVVMKLEEIEAQKKKAMEEALAKAQAQAQEGAQ
jgi:spore coat protein YsxE